MNSLSFEFMERTKSVPLTPYTTQNLYKMKSILVLFWIFCAHLYTSFIFFAGFILFFGIGLALMLALSKEKKAIHQKYEEIFFLLVVYCFLPFYTPMIIYILSVVFCIILMEYFFVHLNGYFINPVLVVLLFISTVFYSVFFTYQPIQVMHLGSLKDYFYSFPISEGMQGFYKDIISASIGFFPYSPGEFLGIFGFILYVLPFIPKAVYRSSFLYFASVCVFAYLYICIISILFPYTQENFSTMILFKNFLYKLFMGTPVFFTALFLIPESLGNPSSFKHPRWFAILNGFFTVVFCAAGVIGLSSVFSVIFVYILFCLFRVYFSPHKMLRGL